MWQRALAPPQVVDAFDGYLAGLLHNTGWTALLRAMHIPVHHPDAPIPNYVAMQIFVFALLLAFFLLEKLVLWRHCHTHDCEAHGMAAPNVAAEILRKRLRERCSMARVPLCGTDRRQGP